MMPKSLYRFRLLTLFLLIALASAAQKKNNDNFHISGRIRVDNGDPAGTVVSLINSASNKTENSATVSTTGKFEFDLAFFSEYRMTVVKDNHYTKDIDVSTMIPSQVWAKDSIFPPFLMVVTIYKRVPNVTLSFEGKVVGKISYSPKGKLDNFDSNIFIDDKDIRKEIDQALKAHEDEIFNAKMAEAVEFEKKNQIREAIHAYEEALAMRKNDPYIKPKLKELASDLKNLEKDALLDAEFNRWIVSGDENVVKLKYPEAIDNFKSALAVKPGNQIASDKLTAAEQLLAKVNAEKAKLDAAFNLQLAAGDALVNERKYPDAIEKFKGALVMKPANPVAIDKIANAGRLLDLANADKAKQEAEFKRLLAAGDDNVANVKYTEAIAKYKDALKIKPKDVVATSNLANAERLLAQANAEKAKQEAEFNRLLAAGDANVTDQKYPEAIGNFKGALAIKVGDKIATDKIANAERLLAQANADKAKQEAEFNRLLAAGDANVNGQKYPEAIENFKGALAIKVGDKIATDRLANAEKLLAQANADKAKQEAEFNRLLAAGDANVAGLKYPEGIVNFKDALKIKPGDPMALTKLSEAEKLLALFLADKLKKETELRLLAEKEKKYKETIARADELFNAKTYPDARNQYKEAIKISDIENYPKARIVEIDSLLAKQAADKLLAQKMADELRKLQGEGSYLKNIQTGDANYAKSLWMVAIFYYQEALKFKTGDKYAVERVDDCKKMIDSNVTAKIMKEYTSFLKKADEDLQAKKYSSSQFYYGEASRILPWENYPKGQLILVEKLISSTDFNGIEAQYFDAVNKADDAVIQKNFAIARFYFQKAISLKPAEEYPKQQLQRLSSEK